MSRITSWRPWRNTGSREPRQATAPDPELQWCKYYNGEGRVEIWPSSADGNWRDKVIVSESFADPQAEPVTIDEEALEKHWPAWNDPSLMRQRAAGAQAEAESVRTWAANRIGLRGAPEAQPAEPEIEPT